MPFNSCAKIVLKKWLTRQSRLAAVQRGVKSRDGAWAHSRYTTRAIDSSSVQSALGVTSRVWRFGPWRRERRLQERRPSRSRAKKPKPGVDARKAKAVASATAGLRPRSHESATRQVSKSARAGAETTAAARGRRPQGGEERAKSRKRQEGRGRARKPPPRRKTTRAPRRPSRQGRRAAKVAHGGQNAAKAGRSKTQGAEAAGEAEPTRRGRDSDDTEDVGGASRGRRPPAHGRAAPPKRLKAPSPRRRRTNEMNKAANRKP